MRILYDVRRFMLKGGGKDARSCKQNHEKTRSDMHSEKRRGGLGRRAARAPGARYGRRLCRQENMMTARHRNRNGLSGGDLPRQERVGMAVTQSVRVSGYVWL